MASTVRPASDFGRDHGLIHEFVVTGRQVGAGEAFYARLAHDRELFRRIVDSLVGDNPNFIGTVVGSYTITVGTESVEEMVSAGRYDFVDPRITSATFPRQRPVESVTIELVEFSVSLSTDEAEAGLAARGLLLPVMEHQLAFGAQHPEVQRQEFINFLGAAIPRGNTRKLGRLSGSRFERRCELVWDHDDSHRWTASSVFAGIRK